MTAGRIINQYLLAALKMREEVHTYFPSDWAWTHHLPPVASVKRVLIRCAGLIVVAGCLREWARLGHGIEGTSFFNLNREQNIGAWFESTAMTICAVLLMAAWRGAKQRTEPWHGFWLVLSITFVGLSIDEASSVHEMVMEVIQSSWQTHGLFKYAWVIPALFLVPLFALASVPFLLSLPRKLAQRFLIAGAVFVTGALGFEMIEGMTDGRNWPFVLCYLAEETLEIVGVLMFLFALLDYNRTTNT